MKSFALLALAAASALPSALAHGFVDKIVVSGSTSKTYKGPEPGSGPGNSIIRLVDNTEPNHIDDGKNLACGKGAATRGAKLTGNANPGDTLSFNWNAGDGTPWPHDSGPLITYMAKCDGDCSSFDATKGKYFKIDEVGKTKVPGNDWYQNTILHAGKMYDVKLPEDLPAGNYIVRHEIIALHLADQLKGAEFYPSCSQFTIGGSNSGSPNETVSFPGAYNENDPGIHINIWDSVDKQYPYPGGDIVSFSGSSSSSSGSNNSTSSSSNNNSSVSNSSSDDNSNDNSSSDGGSNDANDDSGNDSNNSDDGCDDEGDDTNDNSAASGTSNDDANNSNDNNSDDNGDNNNGDDNNGDDNCDDEASTASNKEAGNVVYKTVTVTKTITVTPSATPKVRLARETSSAQRRSRMHRPKKHTS